MARDYEAKSNSPFARIEALGAERDRLRRTVVRLTADALGGYSAAIQGEIIAGDYSHVSEDDIEQFEHALGIALPGTQS